MIEMTLLKIDNEEDLIELLTQLPSSSHIGLDNNILMTTDDFNEFKDHINNIITNYTIEIWELTKQV